MNPVHNEILQNLQADENETTQQFIEPFDLAGYLDTPAWRAAYLTDQNVATQGLNIGNTNVLNATPHLIQEYAQHTLQADMRVQDGQPNHNDQLNAEGTVDDAGVDTQIEQQLTNLGQDPGPPYEPGVRVLQPNLQVSPQNLQAQVRQPPQIALVNRTNNQNARMAPPNGLPTPEATLAPQRAEPVHERNHDFAATPRPRNNLRRPREEVEEPTHQDIPEAQRRRTRPPYPHDPGKAAERDEKIRKRIGKIADFNDHRAFERTTSLPLKYIKEWLVLPLEGATDRPVDLEQVHISTMKNAVPRVLSLEKAMKLLEGPQDWIYDVLLWLGLVAEGGQLSNGYYSLTNERQVMETNMGGHVNNPPNGALTIRNASFHTPEEQFEGSQKLRRLDKVEEMILPHLQIRMKTRCGAGSQRSEPGDQLLPCLEPQCEKAFDSDKADAWVKHIALMCPEAFWFCRVCDECDFRLDRRNSHCAQSHGRCKQEYIETRYVSFRATCCWCCLESGHWSNFWYHVADHLTGENGKTRKLKNDWVGPYPPVQERLELSKRRPPPRRRSRRRCRRPGEVDQNDNGDNDDDDDNGPRHGRPQPRLDGDRGAQRGVMAAHDPPQPANQANTTFQDQRNRYQGHQHPRSKSKDPINLIGDKFALGIDERSMNTESLQGRAIQLKEPSFRTRYIQMQGAHLNGYGYLQLTALRAGVSPRDQIPYRHVQWIYRASRTKIDHVEKLGAKGSLIRKTIIRASSAFCNRGIEEAQTIRRVQDPHIIGFVDFYQQPLFDSIILYPLAERTLSSYLENPTEDYHNQIPKWAGCLLSAVAFLHRAEVNICHRNIQPSNILVKGSKIYLSGFGEAMVSTHSLHKKRNSNMDSIYDAPEVFKGGICGKEADVYALGVIILEFITLLRGIWIRTLHKWVWNSVSKASWHVTTHNNIKAWVMKIEKLFDRQKCSNCNSISSAMRHLFDDTWHGASLKSLQYSQERVQAFESHIRAARTDITRLQCGCSSTFLLLAACKSSVCLDESHRPSAQHLLQDLVGHPPDCTRAEEINTRAALLSSFEDSQKQLPGALLSSGMQHPVRDFEQTDTNGVTSAFEPQITLGNTMTPRFPRSSKIWNAATAIGIGWYFAAAEHFTNDKGLHTALDKIIETGYAQPKLEQTHVEDHQERNGNSTAAYNLTPLPRKSYTWPMSTAEHRLEEQLRPGQRRIFRECLSMLSGESSHKTRSKADFSEDTLVNDSWSSSALSSYAHGDRIVKVLIWLIKSPRKIKFSYDIRNLYFFAGSSYLSYQAEDFLSSECSWHSWTDTLHNIKCPEDFDEAELLEMTVRRDEAKDIVESLKHVRLEDFPDEPSVEAQHGGKIYEESQTELSQPKTVSANVPHPDDLHLGIRSEKRPSDDAPAEEENSKSHTELPGDHTLDHRSPISSREPKQNLNLSRASSLLETGLPASKPFKCDLCTSAFNRLHNLKRHRFGHSMKRPFRCSHCRRTFAREENLQRHVLTTCSGNVRQKPQFDFPKDSANNYSSARQDDPSGSTNLAKTNQIDDTVDEVSHEIRRASPSRILSRL
ncbi:MAG: hypothetical protein M1831_000634 [Alyxoria varia]|nr:MAG: hypothetical protein M1831_000634 [Alyxoria varia]